MSKKNTQPLKQQQGGSNYINLLNSQQTDAKGISQNNFNNNIEKLSFQTLSPNNNFGLRNTGQFGSTTVSSK